MNYYPQSADFAALWQDIQRMYTSWRASSLLTRIELKLSSQDAARLIGQATRIMQKTRFGRTDFGQGRYCVSMLDSWHRESQELLAQATQLAASPRLTREHVQALQDTSKQLREISTKVDASRKALEGTLKMLRGTIW